AHDGGADGTASVLWSQSGLTLPSGFEAHVTAGGTVLTISQQQGESLVAVVRLTITDPLSGAYSVTQLAAVNHPQGTTPGTEDNVGFTVSYVVTDGDNDTATGTLSINVDDDTPIIDASLIGSGLVEEEQGSVAGAGNEDGTGAGDADHIDLTFPFVHDDTTAKTSGSLGIEWGADRANDGNGQPGDRSVQFAGIADPAGLTSRGAAVHYTVVTSPSGQPTLVAYTGTEPGTVPATAAAAVAAGVVFTVALSDASAHGSYAFTLYDVLDQHGAGEDTLTLSFQFTATDSDGDTTAPGTFTVGVIDDAPVAGGTLAARFVEEEQLAAVNHPQGTTPGTEDNVGFTVSYVVTDGDNDTATGTLSINVDDDT
ncbi:MAG: hypothetical protein J0I00_00110, partial [Burkholderiales bacterium]|nr:hypothetical protein [Burkholderiales bacterium]